MRYFLWVDFADEGPDELGRRATRALGFAPTRPNPRFVEAVEVAADERHLALQICRDGGRYYWHDGLKQRPVVSIRASVLTDGAVGIWLEGVPETERQAELVFDGSEHVTIDPRTEARQGAEYPLDRQRAFPVRVEVRSPFLWAEMVNVDADGHTGPPPPPTTLHWTPTKPGQST